MPEATPRDQAPAHRRRARVDRRPVLAALAVVAAVGLAVGRGGARPPRAGVTTGTGPVVAPAAALTSSWFCAGATDTATGAAPGRLVLANAGAAAVAGTVTLVPDHGARVAIPVSVPALGRIVLREAVPGGAAWLGALVDLSGGEVSVEQQITSTLGDTAEPCATAGSTSWYFAGGATLVNATSTVSLLNPYATPAIADLTFTTNQGVEAPGDFQGVVVPPDSVVPIDLRSHLRRRTAIATSVSVTAGRLVAWKTDVVTPPAAASPLLGTKAASQPDADPASPYPGVTETLGAPAPSTSWYWPEGGSSAGLTDRYAIYNPGPGTAMLQLAVSLDQGTAEPYSLKLGPDEVVDVSTAGLARIPSGVGYSAELVSTNGVGVVAERVVDAAAPSTLHGTAELLGASRPADRWVVAAGHTSASLAESIVVSNPGTTAARVALVALAGGRQTPVTGIAPAVVAAHGRLVWNLGSHQPGLAAAVVVRSTIPVVVGRDLVGQGRRPGIGLALAVPAP